MTSPAVFIGIAVLIGIEIGALVFLLFLPRASQPAEPSYWADLHRAAAVVIGEHEKSQGQQEWWTLTCSGGLQSHTYCVVDAGYSRPGSSKP